MGATGHIATATAIDASLSPGDLLAYLQLKNYWL